MPSIHISSEGEFRKYKNSSKLTVVDFTASWCGPCKMVAPRFEQLSNKYPNVNFLKVDVDEQRGISSEHEVRAMPTFQFFISGRKVDEVVGADIAKVERLVANLAKSGGSSGFPSGGGRVLGSGAPAGGGSTLPSLPTNLNNLTPMQQQYLIFGAIILFFTWMYFSKGE
ncbi:Thioredoxin domain-containing protein 2 [Phlyctochytrium bullatum]|nr:Thioredoxin domain-containing protein 2 [Phlyctochytrium bullatum]